MYNSVLISFLMKITRKTQNYYSYSLLNKLVVEIGSLFTCIYKGSFLNKISANSTIFFVNSTFYKLVGQFLSGVDYVLDSLHDLIKIINKGSLIAESLGKAKSSFESGFRLFYDTFILLGLILLVSFLILQNQTSLILGAGLLVLGLLGVSINGKEIQIIRNSIIISFFLDLFELDKGGEAWW